MFPKHQPEAVAITLWNDESARRVFDLVINDWRQDTEFGNIPFDDIRYELSRMHIGETFWYKSDRIELTAKRCIRKD